MKRRLLLLLLSLAPAWCQIAKPAVLATSNLPRAQGGPHPAPDDERIGAHLQ